MTHFLFNCQKYKEQRRKMQESLELMRNKALTLENLFDWKKFRDHHLWLLQNS